MSAVGVWMQLHAQADKEHSAEAVNRDLEAEREAALKHLHEEKKAR